MPHPKKVIVQDRMQPGYTYVLSAPLGKNFHPEFKPDLTPKEMLELGIFDGVYVDNMYHKEFPNNWFTHARLSSGMPDVTCNYFKVHASQPLKIWQQKGWIYKDDPRGWFQWYCRYYMGRRLLEEDMRQIKRWKSIRRHIGQLVAHCRPGDTLCRPKQRQALLHWAYDTRKL